MTQAGEPDDRGLDRTLRSFDLRISRLEDTQVTWRELNTSLVARRPAFSSLLFETLREREAMPTRRYANGNRVYDQIDAPEAQMNLRFDEQSQKLDEQNRKIDIILRHITGEGNA
jgi:hypothetical protein